MKSLFAGTLASFALLTLVASPSRADSHTTGGNAIRNSGTEQQINQKISQTKTPSSPTQQQPDDKGCGCCKKMMGNMQMDNKMHQMMENQQNPSR